MKKKLFAMLLLLSLASMPTMALAGTHGKNGELTGRSVAAGALSLLIWPGIGQAINDDKNDDKAITHALLGLTGVFRIWSGYDALVNRKGGVWENRI